MSPCENWNLPPAPSSPPLHIRHRCFLNLIKQGAVEGGREKGRSGRDIPLLRSSIAVMKGSGAMVAVASSASALTVAASYSSALSAALSDAKFQSPSQAGERQEQRRSSPVADRFAPKFDGLRFIETLVTAHR